VSDSSALVGRSFATHVDLLDEPVWEPLETVARWVRARPDVDPFHPGEFMWMYSVRNTRKNLAIHLYKHVDTRRYLNLGDDGHAYAYVPSRSDGLDDCSGGKYRRYRSPIDAIDHLELWLFFDDPPLFRSFPPTSWPPDETRLAVNISHRECHEDQGGG
jgi:hypothetical protein